MQKSISECTKSGTLKQMSYICHILSDRLQMAWAHQNLTIQDLKNVELSVESEFGVNKMKA